MNEIKGKKSNHSTQKSSLQNGKLKNDKISPYFGSKTKDSNLDKKQENSSQPKDISWSEMDDFKSPIPLKKPKALTKPTKTKIKKEKKKQATLEEVIRNNLSHSDMNPDHLQMAIALSKSTYEVNHPESSNEDLEFSFLSSQEKKTKIRTTLLEYGFKSDRSKLPTSGPLWSKPATKINKKSKFRFVTPTLNIRTEEERQSLIQSKTASIISSNEIPVQHIVKTFINSEFLQKIIAAKPIYKLNYEELEELTFEKFRVSVLNLNFEKTRAGNLFKNWHSIPCRDVTPERNINFNEEKKSIMFNPDEKSLNTSLNFDYNLDIVNNFDHSRDFNTSEGKSADKEIFNRSISPDLFDTSFINHDIQNICDSVTTNSQSCSFSKNEIQTLQRSDSDLGKSPSSCINTENGICHYDKYSSGSEVLLISSDEDSLPDSIQDNLKNSLFNNESSENKEINISVLENREYNSFKFNSKTNTDSLNITEHINEILNTQVDDPVESKNISLELKRLINDDLEKTQLVNKYFETDFDQNEIDSETDYLYEYNADLDFDRKDDLLCSTPLKVTRAKSESFTPTVRDDNRKKLHVSRCKSESTVDIIVNKTVTPMSKYDELSTPKITEELGKFGIKPLKRKRAIALLKHIYEATHPIVKLRNGEDERDYKKRKKDTECAEDQLNISEEGENVEIVGDKLLENENLDNLIFEKRTSKKLHTCYIPLQIVWHNFVSSHPEIREKILTYKPLHIDFLQSKLKAIGYKFNEKDLIYFLDQKCITIRIQQKNRFVKHF